MKKSFFILFLLLAISVLLVSAFLFIDFNKAKHSIYRIIFNRMINQVYSISDNLKKDILKYLPQNENWFDFLKTHPKIRAHIQEDFSLVASHNIKYIYLLGVKRNKLIFLADGSKEDRAEFGEIFEPINKKEFESLKPHYFYHRKLKSLFLTYIDPIVINNKLKGFIVIDLSVGFSHFIKKILEDLSKSIYLILFFSIVLFVLLIFFAHFDLKREREKEELLLKLTEANLKLERTNKELEQKVMEKVEEIRKKDLVILNQSKLAAMGEMLNMIAHQWRQPLNALSAAAIKIELESEMKGIDEESCIKFAKFVEDSTQRLSEIINDFMNFSKNEKDKEEFFIKDVVKEVIKLSNEQLKNHNISVIVDIDDNLKIKSFKKDLMHVLLNLVSNARDVLDERKKEDKEIKIYATKEGKIVKIIVEDNAGGVDEKIKDRIFEPYFTTKAPNKGTGIGLYMSKKIVEEKLNGRLYFENTDKGAKFIIELKDEDEI